MTTATTVLDARGLTKTFGSHTVLHGVDLQVQQGEFVSVMGPSGSGKSTLLHTISGMDTISSGAVRFAGQDLTSLTQRQLANLRLTSMGFVFQHVHLLKNLCLLDNVVLPGYLAGLSPRDEVNERAVGLMELTKVDELANRDVSEASGGQLQRVAICRALINQPSILLGDEPTGALDSTAASDIMDILGRLNAFGMTIVLVTHDPKVAAYTDRVLYLVDGRLVGDLQQSRYTGADLDQRRTDVTQWLTQHDIARSRQTVDGRRSRRE